MATETPAPVLSVVIPVYNEEESLQPLVQRLRAACEPLGLPYEVLFVDDGSQDSTFATLEALHRQDGRLRVLRFRKNYGQTAAMAAGFRHARGQVIVSMDGDLQNDPADIPRLLAKLEEGYDVVCGWRKARQDKLLSRRVPSLIANWLIGKVTGVPIHDNGCSLKAYRAEVIKRVQLYAELHRFIPAMSTLTGARIAELVVRHHPRRFGRSKYGISRTWRVFLDLFVVKMLTAWAARPRLWFATLAVVPLLGSLGSLVGWGLSRFASIVFPAVAFLALALVGHLLVMGLLAELVLATGDFRPEAVLVVRGHTPPQP
ncbi:MAG: dolichol-phosphate mannosyltransferase [Candidatus Tectimicrobiota bacterium]|nr:MAG: dolichol-phosphate mannosyltransferase [Candidatus Tectomicrobia bacterium]